MNRYQGNINAAISNSSAIQFAASYTVYVTPVGGRAASGSSGAVITLDRGHSFRVDDRFILNPGTDNILSAAITAVSDSANTITTGATTYTIVAGDLLVNIGPDTSGEANTPEYDQIPMAITDQPDGGGIYATPSVTTDASGNFEFYHRGDGKFWLLIIDSTAAIASVIQGVGGMGRNNICDYGAVMDGSTDDHDRIVGAILALPDNGGEVYCPAGDIYFDDNIEVDRGKFHFNCNKGARFVHDGIGKTALKVNPSSTVYDVKVTDMWVYDPDPNGHANSEESHGIHLIDVDRAEIRGGHFDSMGDESVSIAQCVNVLVDGVTVVDGSHEDSAGGSISCNNSVGVIITNCRIYNQQAGSPIMIEVTDPPAAGTSDHIIISNNYIDTTNDTKAVGEDHGVGIICNAGNRTSSFISIIGNHIKDVIAMGISVNNVGGTGTYYAINNNIVEGGGANAASGALQFRGAIGVNGGNYGTIVGNIIDSWGDTAANHSGIHVDKDGFIVTGNCIYGTTNNTYSIHADADGTVGSFITGNISDKPVWTEEESSVGHNKTSTTNVTTLADDATPDVTGGRYFITGGVTAITDLDKGTVGQEIFIRSHATGVQLTDGGNLVLAGNWTPNAAGETIHLIMFATDIWTEISRSDNA